MTYREVPEGAWEWTQKIFTLGLREFTEKKDRYSDSKHLSNLKSRATEIIEEMSGAFPNIVSNLVANYEKSFRSDLKTLIDSRREALEEIKKSKADECPDIGKHYRDRAEKKRHRD